MNAFVVGVMVGAVAVVVAAVLLDGRQERKRAEAKEAARFERIAREWQAEAWRYFHD